MKVFLPSPFEDSARTSFRMEPLLKRLLRSFGGSEGNFLEVCFGRTSYGHFHTKATSKKFRPPSGNFRPNPPELPRSPSGSFSSHKTGWKILLFLPCPLGFRRFFQKIFRIPNPYWSQSRCCSTPPTCTAARPPFISLHIPGF